ncbi:hypothetical protein Z948_39 [Sulfitobacter donghicola DSW-25 = KCTC 12864 = JCM 14565]|nr:hypothetical protein Z948_39 [Sulfitobacter donghicola DSW-25 = KCTC 12864 = JCM 14565]
MARAPLVGVLDGIGFEELRPSLQQNHGKMPGHQKCFHHRAGA